MISDRQRPIEDATHALGAHSEPHEVLAGMDLHGKCAIVTGGYSGIGLETTKALAQAGATVIVPARRVDMARQALEGVIPADRIPAMDLADPRSVQAFVDSFLATHAKLDLLINNAGIMACDETRTPEGWEMQFAVNQVGHFVLSKGLLPAMERAEGARLISLSSTAHKLSAIRWHDMHFATDSYDKWQAYGQSKTAASLLAVEVDRRMRDRGVRAFSVHPGGIFTPLQRHLQNQEMVALGWLGADGKMSELAAKAFKTPTQGATTTLWCATSPHLADTGGVYCEDCNIAATVEPGANRYRGVQTWAIDSDDATRLWDATQALLSA